MHSGRADRGMEGVEAPFGQAVRGFRSEVVEWPVFGMVAGRSWVWFGGGVELWMLSPVSADRSGKSGVGWVAYQEWTHPGYRPSDWLQAYRRERTIRHRSGYFAGYPRAG